MEDKKKLAVLEVMLFLETGVLKTSKIVKRLQVEESKIETLIDKLIKEYQKDIHGLKIVKSAGGYSMQVKKDIYPEIQDIYNIKKKDKLNKSTITVLSIIAYKQPITKAELEEIRGVSSDTHIRFLIDKGLIKIVGRKDTLRKPLLYGTTDEFLKYFNLNDIKDLPKIEELKSDEFQLDEE